MSWIHQNKMQWRKEDLEKILEKIYAEHVFPISRDEFITKYLLEPKMSDNFAIYHIEAEGRGSMIFKQDILLSKNFFEYLNKRNPKIYVMELDESVPWNEFTIEKDARDSSLPINPQDFDWEQLGEVYVDFKMTE